MKKCKGCGVILQNDNPELAGYSLNTEQDYCQRCFRLIHYGDANKLSKEKISNKDIIKIYSQYNDEIYILIVDAFDGLCLDNDDLLTYFKDKKAILVINKIDLLPRSVKDDKLEDLFKNVLSRCYTKNIINCLLTYKDDPSFNDLLFSLLSELKQAKYLFVGRVNAGKTTIINKLLNNDDLTVSPYPGTTVKENIVKINNYTFIDTPGLIDEDSFINRIDKKYIKSLIPNKCVKPRVFQFYEEQAYFVEGLIRIDVVPKRNSSITFYVKNELDVHRTKLSNADNYINKHAKEIKLKLLPYKQNSYKNIKDATFYMKGLGYIRIQGYTDVKINVNKDIKIYKCEVVL